MNRLPPIAFVLATAAVVWSVAVVAAVYWLPVYSSSVPTLSCHSGTCAVTGSSRTLVGVNGDRVLAIVGVLVAMAVVGWIGLHFRCKRGSRLGLGLGWAAAAPATVLAFISFGLSVFVLPLSLMMLFAAAKTPSPRAT